MMISPILPSASPGQIWDPQGRKQLKRAFVRTVEKGCDDGDSINLWYHPASSSMHLWPQQSGAPGYEWRVRFYVCRIQLGASGGGTIRTKHLKREPYTG